MAPKRLYYAYHITGDMSGDYLPLWDNNAFVSNQESEAGVLREMIYLGDEVSRGGSETANNKLICNTPQAGYRDRWPPL
jgi:hypothetical protein